MEYRINNVRKGVIYTDKSPKRWTINHCLFKLGAKRREVYFGNNGKTRYEIRGENKHSYRSIYDKHSKEELKLWAENLFKEAAQKFHPDLHNNKSREMKRYYTRKFQEVCEAYEKGKKILEHQGRR